MIYRSDDVPSRRSRHPRSGLHGEDGDSPSSWPRIVRFLSFGITLWMAYATVAWLRSSHPVGAIAPAIIALSLAPGVVRNAGSPPNDRAILVLGPLSVLGIAVLWIAAGTTDEPALHRQAVSLSLWGGLLVFLFVIAVTARLRHRDHPDESASTVEG